MFAHSIRRTPIVLYLLAVLVLTMGGTIAAQPASGSEGVPADASFRSSPVMFIENAGQWDEGARFQVWGGPAGTMWLAEDAIWITVVERSVDKVTGWNVDALARFNPERKNVQRDDVQRKATNIKLSFAGANPHPRFEPFDRLDTVVSYFIGDGPDKWRPAVPVWGGLRYMDLYPGVDLEITSEGGQMVQRLAARSGADLSAVQLRVEGAEAVAVDGDALRLSTTAGDAVLPLLMTDGLQVAGSKVQMRGTQVFDVTAPLTAANFGWQSHIENRQSPADNPADLLYGTFLGGGSGDESNALAVDGTGSAYVAGRTFSSDFPTTPGAFDTSHDGYYDAFVVKLSPTGSGLAYATFLGGSLDDSGDGIALDGTGDAYVTGDTRSDDFPTTSGTFDTSHNGYYDAFVVKLSPTGNGLLYGTFLGSGDHDEGRGVAVDTAGSAYVTGVTDSSDFPTTTGAFDRTHNGSDDAFVVKLNAAGRGLLFATFLGGSSADWSERIAVDGAGSAYVTGWTASSTFPTTSGAFDPRPNGGDDAFVVKLNPAGSGLAYATYLGGSSDDAGVDIAVDEADNAYVTGLTYSNNFPTTSDTFDRGYNGYEDAFVARLNPDGNGLAYATYLGGSDYDFGVRIAVDGVGNAYVTGPTYSNNFPTTSDAFDTSNNGGSDSFVAKLRPNGSGLTYATFLGGSEGEYPHGIAVDGAGCAYVTGWTGSSNFPTTSSAFDQSYNGPGGYYDDAFVIKLAIGRLTFPPAAYLPLILVSPPAGPCQRYEPNDSLSTAWGPLVNGQAIEVALCSGDPDDYFYLDLASGTALVLDLTNLPAGTDYDLVLYNAAGGQLAASRNYGNAAERISRGVAAGRYYVRIYPNGAARSGQSYRLTASWGTAAQGEEPTVEDWGKPEMEAP